MLFLEASDAVLQRRYSETRRPHPLGTNAPVKTSLTAERRRLRAIRAHADLVIDTSKFNVHELRAHINELFQKKEKGRNILVSCVSFGFRHGVPDDADLVFDVRFLPNPHFVPEFRPLTGRDPKVVKYIRSFPQTLEFIRRVKRVNPASEIILYHYTPVPLAGDLYDAAQAAGFQFPQTLDEWISEDWHRSVMIAEDVAKHLKKAGYRVKVVHRDSPK